MSSAANHRARSHRSHYLHRSAMRGERMNYIRQQGRNTGAAGTPLIYRLQAMFRRAREARRRRNTEEGGAGDDSRTK